MPKNSAQKSPTVLTFKEFCEDYGTDTLRTFFAIHAPTSASAFVEELYATMEAAIAELERGRDEYQDSTEPALRNHVLTHLKGAGFDASAESQVAGHVDLVVRSHVLKLEWLGEAKTHSSYPKLDDGLKQLHTRYSNGKHDDLGFLVFVFTKKATNVVKTWKRRVVDKKLCGCKGKAVDHAPSSFTTKHNHSSGRSLRTRHFFAWLHHDPQDKSGRTSKKAATKRSIRKKPAHPKRAHSLQA